MTSDPHASPHELVERKGLGHPDTICDALAEAISRTYSQFCLREFGRVAHHWFDKVMLIGGEADIGYGKGVILEPYRIIVAGKCALRVGSREIPVPLLAARGCDEVLTRVLTGFNFERHANIEIRAVDSVGPGRSPRRYRPQSVDDLADPAEATLVSNDGNIVAAFSPLTRLESMVLFAETFLNGESYKRKNDDVGADIKVFGFREGARVRLLVNVPFLASRIPSFDAYVARRSDVLTDVTVALAERFDPPPTVAINSADGEAGVYLTALGSVADTGDVGVTGRGNRLNGLITPMRPMSIEAPAGKNPLDHTGKLYSLAAQRIADEAAAHLEVPVEVFIHTAKGTATATPDDVVVNVGRQPEPGDDDAIRVIVDDGLRSLPRLSRDFVTREVVMW